MTTHQIPNIINQENEVTFIATLLYIKYLQCNSKYYVAVLQYVYSLQYSTVKLTLRKAFHEYIYVSHLHQHRLSIHTKPPNILLPEQILPPNYVHHARHVISP